jgi:energy-coupling factor transporter transmembrane protein EcfT
MNIFLSFGLTNAPTYFMYLMNSILMPELDKFIVFSLMTYRYIQQVWKNMKSIYELCFNDYEIINLMQSLASASS